MSAISHQEPLATLRRHGLTPKRSFGQNFLASAEIAERIATLATTPTGGTVVEIGCGLGALTSPLLVRASRVIGIERDRDLVRALALDLQPEAAAGRFLLLEADAKAVDLQNLLQQAAPPRVLCGNLPYQITGVLLEAASRAAMALDRAVFMVQLEVAQRLAARPGTAEYGALSVFLQAQFDVKRAFVVKRGSFFPRPNVDSAVVEFTPLLEPTPETPLFRKLVKAAFAMRRKKLFNAWTRGLAIPAPVLASAAARCGIDLDARGETLSHQAFARLARELGET